MSVSVSVIRLSKKNNCKGSFLKVSVKLKMEKFPENIEFKYFDFFFFIVLSFNSFELI